MWYYNMGFSTASGDSFDDSLSTIGVGLGMNYFMNENIIIDFSLANLFSYAKQGDSSAMTVGWSGEINNVPYLERIGKMNSRIILSTGMSNINEIKFALNKLDPLKLIPNILAFWKLTFSNSQFFMFASTR